MTDTTAEAVLPPALPGEEIITPDEASTSRRPGLREAKCYLWDKVYNGFWAIGNTGYVQEREKAQLNTVKYLIDQSNRVVGYIQGTAPAVPDDGKPKRRCSYMSFMDSQLTAMLKAAPMNETFRARLMARVGEMPPKEADTWEKLVDWVEFNFPKIGKVVPPVPEAVGIKIDVEMSETERGECDYTRRLYRSDTFTISAGEILEMVGENPNNLEDLIMAVENRVSEITRENLSMDTVEGSEETSHHESNDGDGLEVDYNDRVLRERLIAFLNANLTEEQRSELGL